MRNERNMKEEVKKYEPGKCFSVFFCPEFRFLILSDVVFFVPSLGFLFCPDVVFFVPRVCFFVPLVVFCFVPHVFFFVPFAFFFVPTAGCLFCPVSVFFCPVAFFLSRYRCWCVGVCVGLGCYSPGPLHAGPPALDHPTLDRLKFCFFFSPLPPPCSLFLSLFVCLLVEFWWCFRRLGPVNVPIWALGLSCETRLGAGPHPSGSHSSGVCSSIFFHLVLFCCKRRPRD